MNDKDRAVNVALRWQTRAENAEAALLQARAECDGAHMIIAAERAEVIKLRAENVRLRADINSLRAETDAFRMCVNCGLVVPSSHDRVQPGLGCKAPDACTFDMTPREAWEYWRDKAHHHRDAAALASHEGESNEL